MVAISGLAELVTFARCQGNSDLLSLRLAEEIPRGWVVEVVTSVLYKGGEIKQVCFPPSCKFSPKNSSTSRPGLGRTEAECARPHQR